MGEENNEINYFLPSPKQSRNSYDIGNAKNIFKNKFTVYIQKTYLN